MGTGLRVVSHFTAYLLISRIVFITFGEIVRNKDAPLCLGVECKNRGTLDNETCVCNCAEPYTGLFCETEILISEWPHGMYSLPMSQYGCPETEAYGWRTGYINMTAPQSLSPHFWRKSYSTNRYIFLMGPYDSYHIQMNFCTKVSDQSENKTWPKGNYCIYRAGNKCAEGFDSGSVVMTGYKFSASDMSGWLPDVSVKRNKDSSVKGLEVFFCCRNDTPSEEEQFSFGKRWPFYILKNSRECPYQQNMLLISEYFNFTAGLNTWTYTNAHPELTTTYKENNKTNVGMVYCYYTPYETTVWNGEQDKSNVTGQRLLTKEKPLFSSSSLLLLFPAKNAYDGKYSTGSGFASNVNPSWIQIDMEYLHKVVYVSITGTLPSVFVSHEQWVFLHHGATICRFSAVPNNADGITGTNLRYYCRRRIEAQYVTLYTAGFSSFNEIDIVVEGNFCGKQMGIVSGVIHGYQISSDRQLALSVNREICVKSTGNGVYIQVDLIVPMVIQGLKISGTNTKSIASFSIHYGVSVDNLKKYNDTSGKDMFIVNNDATAFTVIWLPQEILTTLFRVNLIEYDPDPCLKLELIGCPRQISRDVRCESSNINLGWVNDYNKLVVDLYMTKATASQLQAKNFEHCKVECSKVNSKCLSATMSGNTCTMYSVQQYTMFRTVTEQPGAMYGEKMCIKDITNTQACLHKVETPGVVESPMYPLYYGEDEICLWYVVFPPNKTIRLEILEIDLPTKEAVCEDQLNLYDVVTPGVAPKFEQLKLVKERHRRSVLYSSSNELWIMLIACHRYSHHREANISRFAINISVSDLVGCGFITEGYTYWCRSRHGILATPFHPSNYFLKSPLTWTIIGSTNQYIQLVFSDIDIPSNSKCGTANVAVFDLHTERINYTRLIGTYCTEYQKRGVITSLWNSLQVMMVSTTSGIGTGFNASYVIKDVETPVKTDTDNATVCPDDWIGWKRYCYKHIQDNISLPWDDTEKVCIEYGGHLLSIEDREEMVYIHHLLTAVWKSLSPAIIGLHKHSSHASINGFQWSNGKVATYFDWFSDSNLRQPDGFSSEQCTLIQPGSVLPTPSWHDYMCAYGYNSFICKLSVESTAIDLADSPVDTNFIDKSWWMTCDKGTVMSIVYRCDGVVDCTDVSDEIDCNEYDIANQFKCSDGKYIHLSLYCDHKADCIDGSDEVACVFRACLEDEWRCANQQCVSNRSKCDFIADCDDGSDEIDCAMCSSGGFQCYEQKCIPESRQGDGFVDCGGKYHEDEAKISKPPVQYSCEAWFRLGKRQSGMYYVTYEGADHFLVECQFPKHIDDKVKVLVHHKLQGRRQLPNSQTMIQYDATIEQIHRLKSAIACEQFVTIECSGHGYVNFILYWNMSSLNTINWKATFPTDQTLTCDLDGFRFLSTKAPYFWLSSKLYSSLRDIPLWGIADNSFYTTRRAVTISPVVCEEKLQNTTHENMLCKNGIITDRKHRCILKLYKNGEVEGCRDMSHLEDCRDFVCPETYVKCPGSFCVPRYMYCDGLKHCPNGADEVECEKASCSGLFKCRDSSVCVPISEICDGIKQCKHGDDELMCGLQCPVNCTCEGLIFTCSGFPNISQVSHQVRKLSISNVDVDANGFLVEFTHFSYLVHLSITHTNLTSTGNNSFYSLKSLYYLDISNNLIERVDAHTFNGLNNLLFLNISRNKITNVFAGTFMELSKLHTLDMRDNSIELFHSGMFAGMSQLQYLFTDEYKFCCVKPDSVADENCYPSKDEFSSCRDLMRDISMRICLWTIGTVALVGNGMSVVYRLGFDADSLKKSHGLFVLSLCVSDFLMGVYLYVIAIADEYYRGRYIYDEYFWKNSVGCKIAGVIVTLSSEVSTTMLCFITLDRVLAIKYPLSTFKFNALGTKVAVLLTWLVNLCISMTPLIGIPYFEDKFYSKSGTCLALPLTRDRPPGWQYAVFLFLAYNFFAFSFIVTGQLLIYIEIRAASSTSIRKSGGQEQNITIARNLFLIVFTDFLCWFPIAIMGQISNPVFKFRDTFAAILGLAALSGRAIPAEVYAWTTVFILPINSALNPLLYTLNAYRQKQRNTRHRSQITELTSEIEKLRHTKQAVARGEQDVVKNLRELVDHLQKQNENLLARNRELETDLEVKGHAGNELRNIEVVVDMENNKPIQSNTFNDNDEEK